LNCLLAIMTTLDDTCVLARGGPLALETVQDGAGRVLARGGAATDGGKQALRELEIRMAQTGASPGGAADLLAATLFLDRVTQTAPQGIVEN
jgi:triphosphoribosyl-dephospho-CoA synthase